MRKLAIVFLLFTACRQWPEPEFDDGARLPNVMIGDLRKSLWGMTQMTVTEDITIAGRVVSSDRDGNFYNTFFIDDGTGAVEIMAGMSDLDATYMPGQQVVMRLKGVALGWRDGVLQLGLPPDAGSRYATGYFYHRAVIERWVTTERSVETIEPTGLTISELTSEFCGRPVRISGVMALTPGATWASTQPTPTTGYAKFGTQNADNKYITVITSGYASWALATVPEGEVTLTGILFFGKGDTSQDHFLLKLRYVQDVDY